MAFFAIFSAYLIYEYIEKQYLLSIPKNTIFIFFEHGQRNVLHTQFILLVIFTVLNSCKVTQKIKTMKKENKI